MNRLVTRFPVTSFALLAYAFSTTAALTGAPDWVYGSGPLLAASLCQLALSGRAGCAAWLRECFAPRMNRAAWLLAVVTPCAILLAAWLLGSARHGSWLGWRESASAAPGQFAVLLAAVAWNGPGEEPGWRGFALPRLLRRFTALGATLAVSALWVPWHYPALYLRGEFTPLLVPAFSLALLFGAIWLTAIYRLSGGSVFASIVWHACWNVCATIGRHLEPSVFPWMGALVMVVALGLLAWRWRDFRHEPDKNCGAAGSPVRSL